MKILAIETSCDDTSISVLEAKGGKTNASFKVLAEASHSQAKAHSAFGGVYPNLAKNEHTKNLPLLLKKLNPKDIDLITVTYGPGLEPSLWTGITFAKELAKKWSIPVVPVNHMEGHILSVFGKSKGTFKIEKIKFPALALLVSGGHTQLVLIRKWMQYKIIGETVDDAVGEAFDKVARMLGLPYPGGPHISKLAEEFRENVKKKQGFRGLRRPTGPRTERVFQQENSDPETLASSFTLPRPMLKSPNFNFSYAGLKTAVLYLVRDLKKSNKRITKKVKSQIALEFENAAIECLTYKTAKAIEKYKVKTLLVAGGVAANKHLKNELKVRGKKLKINILFPEPQLATDNSIMIGIAGYLNYLKNKHKTPKPSTIKATGNLKL